jgi:pimeloyl-ACP methyl ester carboxylesterase
VPSIGALVVHGMGRQTPGFSHNLRDAVFTELGPEAARIDWEEVDWASILEPRESDLWSAMNRATNPAGAPIRLDLVGIREFVLHNFGDATAYQRDVHAESAGVLVHQRVSNHIEALLGRLGSPDAPVIVLAHSLGGHIMSNYLWDRQHPPEYAPPGQPLVALPGLAGMITFGCNIPLFALAFRDARPIDFPGAAIQDPDLADATRWLNFLDKDDVLGWPLRPLYLRDYDTLTPAQRRTVDKLEDYEISVGGLLTGWTPASHDRYWEDDDFIEPVAEYFGEILSRV